MCIGCVVSVLAVVCVCVCVCVCIGYAKSVECDVCVCLMRGVCCMCLVFSVIIMDLFDVVLLEFRCAPMVNCAESVDVWDTGCVGYAQLLL